MSSWTDTGSRNFSEQSSRSIFSTEGTYRGPYPNAASGFWTEGSNAPSGSPFALLMKISHDGQEFDEQA